jgi:hypothetical protein
MPTVFRPSTSGPITIGDEYRLFKRSSTVTPAPPAPPVVPVVDNIQDNAVETKDAETVDAVEEKDDNIKEEQPVEKKRARGESSGADDSTADGEGHESTPSAPESKRSKIAAVPGEGDGTSQVGESSSSVRVEQEQSDTKQETEEGSSTGAV